MMIMMGGSWMVYEPLAGKNILTFNNKKTMFSE